MSIKVTVDMGECEVNALCVFAAPDVFAIDDDSELQLLADEVSDDRLPELEQAAQLCPKAAISLTTVSG